MDPNYISHKPGKSPMGMDLIPVYEDEQPQETGIRVDPSFMQNFAVRTVKAQLGSIPVDIRTVGILDYNEKNLALINTKFEGWIEKAYVNYVGEPVKKGQVLFEDLQPATRDYRSRSISPPSSTSEKLSEHGRPRRGRARPLAPQCHRRAPALLGHRQRPDYQAARTPARLPERSRWFLPFPESSPPK